MIFLITPLFAGVPSFPNAPWGNAGPKTDEYAMRFDTLVDPASGVPKPPTVTVWAISKYHYAIVNQSQVALVVGTTETGTYLLEPGESIGYYNHFEISAIKPESRWAVRASPENMAYVQEKIESKRDDALWSLSATYAGLRVLLYGAEIKAKQGADAWSAIGARLFSEAGSSVDERARKEVVAVWNTYWAECADNLNRYNASQEIHAPDEPRQDSDTYCFGDTPIALTRPENAQPGYQNPYYEWYRAHPLVVTPSRYRTPSVEVSVALDELILGDAPHWEQTLLEDEQTELAGALGLSVALGRESRVGPYKRVFMVIDPYFFLML